MIYAMGDIHGYLDKLEHALDLIAQDGGAYAPVVFVGDLVDRGPQSREVIQYLIDGIAAGKDWTVLKGNHDRLFEWFMEDAPRHDPYLLVNMQWFHDKLGGVETMASYGVEVTDQRRLFQIHADAKANVPSEHVAFLRTLKTYHQVDDVLFVHAGIRPEVPLSTQTETDCLWIRQEFQNYTDRHPWLVIHGHTPIKENTHYGNRINIDAGAAYGGPLVPIVIDEDQVFNLTSEGRVPLLPVRV